MMTQVATTSTNASADTNAKACCAKGPGVLGWICVPLRLILGGLFLFAAYNKMFIKNGPQLFSESIKAFKVFKLPEQAWMIEYSTFVTPWIEIVAGLCLVIGLWTRAAAGVIGGLLIAFMILIGSALSRGLNVSCGCFGKISPFCPEKIGACNIVQNSIMLAAAVLILLCSRHALAVDRAVSRKCCC